MAVSDRESVFADTENQNGVSDFVSEMKNLYWCLPIRNKNTSRLRIESATFKQKIIKSRNYGSFRLKVGKEDSLGCDAVFSVR